MEFQAFLFYFVAILTGLCAIAVVVTQNIVRSAAWLMFALAGTSVIFFLLGADFVAATQLIVYVGGTLVLVVFGVMLTAQGPFISMKTGAVEWAMSTLVGLLLVGVLIGTIVRDPTWKDLPKPKPTEANQSFNSVALGESLLGVEEATPEARLTGTFDPRTAPRRTRMAYLLPFEIVSVHLLVVLIGAAYLARAKRRRGATP
ncbi:MAG: NADH-quinone oxidoreductase subunit J [Gemmataceae bacterium]|nr:NADH-quinone oxidoreductase subunit J [Gemmataceae bacterium]